MLNSMAAQILRPQDCLIERIITVQSPPSTIARNNYHRNAPIPIQQQRRFGKPAVRADHRRPEPLVSKRRSSDDLTEKKVTILKRGEEPPVRRMKKAASDGRLEKLAVSPPPTVVPKEVRILDLRTPVTDMYTGSAFVMSPEPSSLPLPSFSRNKKKPSRSASFDDSAATRDPRRLLRLE